MCIYVYRGTMIADEWILPASCSTAIFLLYINVIGNFQSFVSDGIFLMTAARRQCIMVLSNASHSEKKETVPSYMSSGKLIRRKYKLHTPQYYMLSTLFYIKCYKME